MSNRTALVLCLDTAMLVLVCVLECLSLTGLELHEWLGIVLCPVVLVHVVVQWRWFITQYQRIRLTRGYRVRINALLNVVLFLLMSAVLFSGVLVSHQGTALFGEAFGRVRIWHDIHGWANFSLIVLVGLHLALNWDWMLAAIRRRRPQRPALAEAPALGSTISSHRPPGLAQSLGRGLVVLLIAASAAGAAYFTMAALTELPPESEPSRNEHGAAASAAEPHPLAPRPRSVYLPHGFEQLMVTTVSIALVALTGRYLFRMRL